MRSTSPGSIRRCRAVVARARDGRLRIGYLSADFHQHATSQLMAQMLECHDRSAFEVTLLSAGPVDQSPMRRRLVAGHRAFRGAERQELPGDGRRASASSASTSWSTSRARPTTRCCRCWRSGPAPLQATWLGFPAPPGALYRLPDRRPRRHAARRRRRTSARRSPSCRTATSRTTRAAPCRSLRPAPTGACRKARCCSAPSISRTRSRPRVRPVVRAAPRAARLSALAAAMEHQRPGGADEGGRRARHRLPSGWRSRRCCRSKATSAGSPTPTLPRRLALQRPHHRRRALWVGVPVVTIEGRSFAQRVASSLLRTSGLPELVCATSMPTARPSSPLAGDTDRPRRAARAPAELSARPTDCSTAPPSPPTSRSLYRRMWQRAVAGERPGAPARAIEANGSAHEGGDPGRRTRHPARRGDLGAAQADGRDRRQAGALAHPEDLLAPRHQRLRDLPRLSRLPGEGVLRQLLPAHVGRDLRSRREPHGGLPPPLRAVAGDLWSIPARARRPAGACAGSGTISTTAPSASPTATACRTSTSAPRSASTASRSAWRR
jgi:hypothetical protein